MEPLELVAKWLREGRDDAKMLVDLPWQVREREGYLEASHPRFPFKVKILKRGEILTLIVDPGLVLYTLPREEKLLAFKRLLALNSEFSLVRASVAGDDDRVLVLADLEIKTLNKEVLNDFLNTLISSVVAVYHKLGRADELDDLFYKHILSIAEELMNRGMSEEDAVRYLTVKIALPRPVADSLIRDLVKRRREIGKSYA
ncbi:MAG TPA: hypothetical protein ENF35_03525 [Aciduliprofundum sp.]|nr:hypothetical protein [Aciduliprofundum sp.]